MVPSLVWGTVYGSTELVGLQKMKQQQSKLINLTQSCGTSRKPSSNYTEGLCQIIPQGGNLEKNSIIWILGLIAIFLSIAIVCVFFPISNYQLWTQLCCYKKKGGDDYVPKPNKWKKLKFFAIQSKRNCFLSIIKYSVPFLLFWVFVAIGAIIPWAVEGQIELQKAIEKNTTLTDPVWTYGNSFYYCYQVISSCGFGDLVPSSEGIKFYATFLNFITHGSFLSALFIYSEPLFNFFGLVLSSINKIINFFYFTYLSYYIEKSLGIKETEVSPIKFAATFKILILLIGFLILHFIYAGIIISIETEWDFGLGIYWAWLVTTTIGYGDVLVTKPGSKTLYIFFSVFGYLYYSVIVKAIHNYYIAKPRNQIEKILKKPVEKIPGVIPVTESTNNDEEEKSKKDAEELSFFCIRTKIIKYFYRNITLFVVFFFYLIQLFLIPLPIFYFERQYEYIKYGSIEKWTYLSFCYFIYATVTTVGYGDYVPTMPDTRAYTIYLTNITILLHAYLILKLHKPLHDTVDKLFVSIYARLEKCATSETLKKILIGTREILIQPIGKILFGTLGFVIHTLISAAIIQAIEGWSFFDAYYWSYMSVSTVGLVDKITETDSGKVYSISVLITGIGWFYLTMRYVVEFFYLNPMEILRERIADSTEEEKQDIKEDGVKELEDTFQVKKRGKSVFKN